LNAFSIFAHGLQKVGKTVKHGFIREVSLVLAGCNPGAIIDEVIKHSADEDYEGGEAFIISDTALSLEHGMDPDGNPLEELTHSADDGEHKQEEAKMADEKQNVNKEETVEDVFNTLTEKQKNVVYAIIGSVTASEKDDDGEEDETVKQNVFDKDTHETVLKHNMDDINNVIKTAKTHGTMRQAFEDAGMQGEELAHSIDNVEWLFPDDKNLDTPPRIIDRDQSWVSKVMGGVHHIPFSRFKSMFADLTEEDARAKGYIKGNFKKEQVFGLLRRSTSPTTVYKKQKMDRDDVIDITSYDVVAWLKTEMRTKLNEEIARSILIGDGRLAGSEDKIDEQCIRPIFNDSDLFTIKVQVKTTGLSTAEDKYKEVIKSILRARKEYKGAGNPTFYTTEDMLTEMLLLEDGIGHPLYADEAALARKLRVSAIVTVPQMEGMKGAKGGDFIGLIVNLADYTVGADKGGAVSMFDDFDIDFNAMKYLIETRCSGALTTPFSAMAVEFAA
ncbi:phage major capsid protein, partial [Dysosmobacter sp.]|uniref:phage major capsid protein n=1 Tax=Dysosmobacter sp. TaxID=2591382 RepID=UPI003A8DC8EE